MTIPSRRLLWIAFAAMLPLATAGGISPRLAAPCWFMLAACLSVAAGDALAGARRVRAFEATTPDSVRLTKEVPATLPVTIRNRAGRAARLRLGIVMPEGVTTSKSVIEATLPVGASQIDWPCAGRERGDHRLREVHVQTLSPLGLWEMGAVSPVDCAFRVYPNLRGSATAGVFLRTNDPGIRIYRQVGRGREFENLRQYLPGDSFEDIHWKATARRGHPAVKLYRVEHAQEVYSVIDHSRLTARAGILESYVDATLHLALTAQRNGDRFGLVTFSDRTQKFVRARSGLDHFRLCRETIYNLRAERVSPDFRDVFTVLQLNLRRRALIVFFTALDDALLAETFEQAVPVVSRRHVVLVNAMRTDEMTPLFAEEPSGLDAAYQCLAGQMLITRMRTLQIALANRGVKLAMVDPARIKIEVANQYLNVKRRQLL